MTIQQRYLKLLAFNKWANEVLLDTLVSLPDLPQRAAHIMAHQIISDRNWYERAHAQPQSFDFWEPLPLATLSSMIQQNHENWKHLLQSSSEQSLEKKASYRTSKGEQFASSLHDIIVHIVNHATHHRAQILLLIRQSGETPPLIDYIVYCRSFAPDRL